MFNRIKAVAKKEVKQLKRDWRFLFVLFFFPVFLLAIFGYAVNFDVKHIRLGVYDLEKSQVSRDFIRSLVSSEYFDQPIQFNKRKEIDKALEEKLVQTALIIPADFSRQLNSGNRKAELQFLIDGVDGNTASIIFNYVSSATTNLNAKIQKDFLLRAGLEPFYPIDIKPRFWFNPDLKTTWFLLPGLIAMILIMVAVISISLTLVREKEKGTIEQINVSSVTTLELLIGKSLPYVIISLIDAALILLAGFILFGIVVNGSFILLFLSTLIFISACTSIGIFISVVADTQQVAFTMATFASMLPAVVLSGFIFPIDSMPFLVQIITNITPAKFFIRILRAIMLRGVGVHAFWDQLIYLILFIVVFLGLSIIVRKQKAARV